MNMRHGQRRRDILVRRRAQPNRRPALTSPTIIYCDKNVRRELAFEFLLVRRELQIGAQSIGR
ncbi:hypothetical protein D3C86_2143360 [compost metagenome]